MFTAVTSIGGRCLFDCPRETPGKRFLQTRERASHRGEHRSPSSGADPKLRDGHPTGPAVPGFAVSPSVAWRLVFLFRNWPTPGPANSSEPAIIRLTGRNTSRLGRFPRLFPLVRQPFGINALPLDSRLPGQTTRNRVPGRGQFRAEAAWIRPLRARFPPSSA